MAANVEERLQRALGGTKGLYPLGLVDRAESLFFTALSIGLFVLLWWLATDILKLGNQLTVASPADVLQAFIRLFAEPFAGLSLLGHLAASLYRWSLGVGAAIVIGVPLGIFMAWFESIDAAVSPLFDILRNIPPLAWIPLVILWLGTGTASQATLVFVGAFPPCVLNAHRAIRSVNPILIWAAKTLGAGSLRQLFQIALPTSLPAIFAGMRIAFGNGWMALVGGELVGAPSGLGFLIIRGQENLAPDVIFVGMITIGIIGLVFDVLLGIFATSLLRWRRDLTDE